MVDLNNGPIAKMEDFLRAQVGEIEWEEVESVREKKQIQEEQKKWMRQQFESENKVRKPIGGRIKIQVDETKKAMKQMGKNKASSSDGMMDLIFIEEEYLQIKIEGRSFLD